MKDFKRWVAEKKLDQLKFAREKSAYCYFTAAYCYFTAAATLPSPELSDARLSWAKNSLLTVIVDDFFDGGATIDESTNLVYCVEKWNVDVDIDCCSEQVRIVFLALKDAICWMGDAGFKWQERDVTSHVTQIWLDVLNSMLREVIWRRDAYTPTMNEYMKNASVSFALGPIVLNTMYFVGPKLSEEVVESFEYHNIYDLLSVMGRLLNDIYSFMREIKEELNAIELQLRNGESATVEEEVIKEITTVIKNTRREIMKLVTEEKGSVVPRACKDVVLNMSNVLNLFYATDDGFTGDAILSIVKDIIYEPLS